MGEVQHVNDERIVRRPTLGAENRAAGFRVQSVAGEAVHRLGRDRHEFAPLQGLCQPMQVGWSGGVDFGHHVSDAVKH
ncbi:MAG: hypothetical protein WDM96_16995 [Lacunisphaera sp.]